MDFVAPVLPSTGLTVQASLCRTAPGVCLGAVPHEHASKQFLLLAVGLAGACKLRPQKRLRFGTARVQRRFLSFGDDNSNDNVVGLVFDEQMAQHRNLEDPSHPEQPARILKVFEYLEREGLVRRCVRLDARKATREELELKHTAQHVDAMFEMQSMTEEATIELGQKYDSIFLCPDSLEAALLAAGSVLTATERVCAGEVQSAVCVVRPPGHHAESNMARGFCLFGNVGLAAAMARQKGLSARTLIVDFDVHHGNGTHKMFEDDQSVLFCSVHRYDRGKYYPTGPLGNFTSHGVGTGEGYTVNVPWEVEKSKTPPGDAEFLYAFDRLFLPIAEAFAPDLVLISAGFDAAPGDPLGGCIVTPNGFYEITKRLMGLANGRVVLAQEGGYNVESNSESMAACARALLGDKAPEQSQLPGFNVVDGRGSQPAAMSHVATVEAARKHYAQFWPCLRPQVAYSLLAVSPDRHLEYIRWMTGSEPLENGILGFIAAFVHPQQALYQVMELLEGPDLFDFLAQRSVKLEERIASGLVKQIVKAVHFLHRTVGALHRDIKPENFGFIKPPVAGQPLPELKLFDLGLAWVLKAPVTDETAKTLLRIKRCGTAAYMAPEVWDGNTGPPSDVWGVGVVSYIVTSLEVPFKLMETKQPKAAIRQNPLSFESRAWQNTSADAKHFLEGLLDKSPDTRLTTADALAHDWMQDARMGLPPIAEGENNVNSDADADGNNVKSLQRALPSLPPKSKRSEAGFFESMTFAPSAYFGERGSSSAGL
ncbi:Hdac6 [Symbiodinium natans]|uniref:histone deacetylase n=1 Tax=Symbiodinium natans TaxID=878477 RepID=A0A812IB47_9DINO|nr:Hdac6 [Symbiodinium natans]